MGRNSINLKDIIWVIGVKEGENGRKIFKSIPYVIRSSICDCEDLIDLTQFWNATYVGKVTEQIIKRRFEATHKAKAIKVLNSVGVIKSFVLNHDNRFKDEIDSIKDKYGLDIECVEIYCELRQLTSKEGSELIRTINEGVEAKYNQTKELLNGSEDSSNTNL